MLPGKIQTKIKQWLPKISKLHPKNKSSDRQEYPQLWYCWPQWTRKIKIARKIRFGLCKFFTGHEISKTEWGYGGGKFVDRNCRWCDKSIQVPKQEEIVPEPLRNYCDCLDQLGWNNDD